MIKEFLKNNKIIAILAGIILGLVVAICLLANCSNNLRQERDTYKQNMDAALTECVAWKTKDSLSAAKNDILELRMSELEKYRAEDLATIKALKRKNETLSQMVKENAETKVEIQTVVKDSIIYLPDTSKIIKAIDWKDPWAEFHATIDGDDFNATMTSRDSLLVGTATEYKRFLGFLWKTNKIKSQSVYVTSKNPHTVIQNVEAYTIK